MKIIILILLYQIQSIVNFQLQTKIYFFAKQITKNQYQALRDVEMYLEKKNEKIVQLTYALIKENIANKLIFIGGYNELYGIKIIRSQYYYPKQFIDSKENWILHGMEQNLNHYNL